MYKVSFNDVEEDFANLALAMEWARTLPHFVTITGNGNEIVGKFGVDAVVGNTLPEGNTYTWRKRR